MVIVPAVSRFSTGGATPKAPKPNRMFVRLVSPSPPVMITLQRMKRPKLFAGLVVALLGLRAGLDCPAQTNPPVATLQSRVTGTVEHLAPLDSKFVDRRNVDVWLPPSYATAAAQDKRYPVLYVHDGQNVFDPATSFIGVDWGIDETLTRLIAEQKVPEAIVVAIWNTPKRLAEYMPQRAIERSAEADLDSMFKPVRQKPLGDAYLKYLVTELKPAIDARYRTQPDRAHTSIMGSSMGGLISLSAICEYPEVFGGAAGLSTAWTVAGGGATRDLQNALPDPKTHRIYFDHGTETKDGRYEPLQQAVDTQLKNAGYTTGTNWVTKSFPGEEHSERAWKKRVHEPLEFLLR
jgi:predicted alpha/beta superfamily hydrolase